MNIYGTQLRNQPDIATSRFGIGSFGYGPGGQTYNEDNPVSLTSSGMRSNSVLNSRFLSASGHAMTPQQYAAGGMDPISAAQQQRQQTPMWRRPAGVSPSEWTYNQSGGTLGTQPAAVQGGLAGAIQNGGFARTGINATPPWGALGAAQSRLMNPSQAAGMNPRAVQELQRQFGGIMGTGLNRASLDMGRSAAEQFAQLIRQGQVAQSNAGLGWANLGQRFNEINLDEALGQSALGNDRLRLLTSILGGV